METTYQDPFSLIFNMLSEINEKLERQSSAPIVNPATDKQVITAQELRERLEISKATEREYCRKGLLLPKYLGRRVFYVWADVIDTLRRNDDINQPPSFKYKRAKLVA
ncbi:hypothetical protein [Xanthocytophaga agilis]|uniref:Helix-turn-helix domain-containing protein n=1 Tax=Xanthocytophaga agilis TaxID=3048010 RepID=A0AAE3R5L5_9BACT|nr:hypothetical protein [Xanthocytophaga agilis]MDJ1501820.1 hypothetical protein [Xanthocytophaga agilis]